MHVLYSFLPQIFPTKPTAMNSDIFSLKKFAANLADSLRTHCQKDLQFDSWIVVTGSLYIHVDTGQRVSLNVDQKITKQSQESAVIRLNVPQVTADRTCSGQMSTAAGDVSAPRPPTDPNSGNQEETDYTEGELDFVRNLCTYLLFMFVLLHIPHYIIFILHKINQ